jgi:hypothetical protein
MATTDWMAQATLPNDIGLLVSPSFLSGDTAAPLPDEGFCLLNHVHGSSNSTFPHSQPLPDPRDVDGNGNASGMIRIGFLQGPKGSLSRYSFSILTFLHRSRPAYGGERPNCDSLEIP